MSVSVAHERSFGVEIECGYGNEGTSTWNAHETVAQVMVDEGYPMRHPGRYPTEREKRLLWSVGRDGSGVEVRTPILKGKQGFKALENIFELLNEMGCYVTQRDGLHVHHDAPEFVDNPPLTARLVKTWVASREPICEMVTPYRKRSMGAWRNQDLKALDAWVKGEMVRDSYGYEYFPSFGRNELNIAALDEHGSIEFRLHEGTLDIDDAIAWIKFGQRFMHYVSKRQRAVKPPTTNRQLLNRIRLNPTAQAILNEKRRKCNGLTA